jgi:hypothetical protein
MFPQNISVAFPAARAGLSTSMSDLKKKTGMNPNTARLRVKV